jgi:NAD(P)-dependent dehydrogenase (short-subunit alcohol dehydrogenase family)
MTRRDLLKPAAVGVTLLGLGGLSPKAFANHSNSGSGLVPAFEGDEPVPVREGLGIVIVGASSGMGAELARQYAAHGAYIVLAARRTDRLNDVAAEVANLGGFARVVITDVRNEQECIDLIQDSISWLAENGKVIDILALAPIRSLLGAFGPEISTEVWRNVIDTNYFGPAFCLQHAIPHLKDNASTVFYFNSISSSVGTPFVSAYAASKHAWQGIMKAMKFENPELTVVSSQFNAVDTEAFDKELTFKNDDKRYCPSFFKTYSTPASQMYPEPIAIAIEKVVQAIESQTTNAFLRLYPILATSRHHVTR